MTTHHTIGKRVQVGVFDVKGDPVGFKTKGVVVATRMRKPVYSGARKTMQRQYDVQRDFDGKIVSYWDDMVDFGIMGEFK